MLEENNFWRVSGEEHDVPLSIKDKLPSVLAYAKHFLLSEHPYRKGIMCPFMFRAVANDSVLFTHVPTKSFRSMRDQVNEIIDYYNNFRLHKPQNTTAIFVIFEDIFPIDDLLRLHHALKVKCIHLQIMIGATYADNNAPSLHCDQYYPLRTALPCLILRDLTVHDLVFLDPRSYSIQQRVNFLSSYIEKFRDEDRALHSDEVGKANQLLISYKKTIFRRRIMWTFLTTVLLVLCLLWVSTIR